MNRATPEPGENFAATGAEATFVGKGVLREIAKRMERLSAWPGYAPAMELWIRYERVITTILDYEARLLTRLTGRGPAEAERREDRERQARRNVWHGPRPPGWLGTRREPVAFWHEGGVGPVVLLLNGWTASGLVWPGDWLARLERRYRVVRVDNRGTGWSRTAPAPFTIGDMAEDAAEVLRGIGAVPATVLGLSMGGMIAQELALRHPDLVERLVLVGTRPPAPSHIPAAAPVRDRELDHLLGSGPRRGTPLDAFFRSLWEPQCAPGFADSHPALFDELVAQIVARPTPRAGVIHQLRAIAAWSGSSRLARIKAPTVVVHGALDELIPVGNGMRLARHIPGARYIELAAVGHLVPIEAPDVLAEVIEERA
jgi:pimeloyl-ACP methyl ester carboxylesterase